MAEPRRFPNLRFEAPPGATEIVLVRHGESAPAVEGEAFSLVGGHGDPPLSPLGRWQAEMVGRRLAAEQIAAIFVSSLQRTAQTAEPLAEALGLTPVVDPDLREVFLGEWEGGLYRQKVAERDPVAMRAFAEERWDLIPGAEPADAFARRVVGAVERMAGAHGGRSVVAVSHGGVIGQILSEASGARPFAFVANDNAAISRVLVTPERWLVRRFNDIAHLEPELPSTGP